MSFLSRRSFLHAALLAPAIVRGKATDTVTLGKSKIHATRLAFGTGTFGGRVQRELGQEGFTRLVRHAYDSGIRFFETAESYGDMHRMLGIALKGIPRDTYRLMSKVTTRPNSDAFAKIDELRTLAQTDYFDILLLHNQRVATWPVDARPWQDALREAKHRQAILSHGASVHGLPSLRQFPGNPFLEVALMRINHKGVRMDAEDYATRGLGDVPEVLTHMKAVHQGGVGVIGMKLIGEGAFTKREDRKTAMRFAFRNAGVDCVTVGFKSPAEIDEAIQNLNLALA
jgi:aryl-alcohol dehydrogenase-like predicted oxidoreductase